ncbi:vitamin K epoxide reductase family protein [Patescibacteria group bacterium]
MNKRTSLTLVLILSILGLLLSGYLSYYSLFTDGCTETFINCGTEPVEIFGLPNCVYGFFMYLLVFVLAVIGLMKSQKAAFKTLVVLGIVGTLFAASLSVYELFFLDVEWSGLPACVYGFFLYLGIFIFSILASKKNKSDMIDGGSQESQEPPKEDLTVPPRQTPPQQPQQ